MCLGIAGRIVDGEASRPEHARIELGGAVREVDVTLLDERPAPGDWVLVHLGFALQRLSPEEARQAMVMLDIIGSGGEAAPDQAGPWEPDELPSVRRAAS